MATTTWTEDEIERALRQRDRDGLSWRALSDRCGHPVWRLRYVARKLATRDREVAPTGGFVEVVPVRPSKRRDAKPIAGRITIELRNGIRLHVDRGIRPSYLRDLIRAAGE